MLRTARKHSPIPRKHNPFHIETMVICIFEELYKNELLI